MARVDRFVGIYLPYWTFSARLDADWEAECGYERTETYTDSDGNLLGQRVTALERVGVYVPGGQAAYPSTVLMAAVPARVAGVGEIVMTVPTPDGVRSPLVLAAALVEARPFFFSWVCRRDFVPGSHPAQFFLLLHHHP